MTDLTMEEGFNSIINLDSDIVQKFVNWYDNERNEDQSEFDSEYYNDIYGPVSEFSFTNFDEDEDEICNDHDFYKKVIRWSDGVPEHYIRLAEIIDETGF